MAQIPIPRQLLNDLQSYFVSINHQDNARQVLYDFQEYFNTMDQENARLTRRIIDLETRCTRNEAQINALNQIVAGLQAAKAKPAQPAQAQAVKAQASQPAVPKKPPPPLPVSDSEPVAIRPVDMDGQEDYQRRNGFKPPPPDAVVRHLNLETTRVKRPPFKEPAHQPPAVPPKATHQNPPIPAFKPPPGNVGSKAPSVQAGDQQSVIEGPGNAPAIPWH